MQGQEMALSLEDQALGCHLCCTKGSVCHGTMGFKNICNKWLLAALDWSCSLLATPAEALYQTFFFSCPFQRLFEARKLYQNTHIFDLCVFMYVFKHTSHLEYFKMLDIMPQMTFYKSNGISNIYYFMERKSVITLAFLFLPTCFLSFLLLFLFLSFSFYLIHRVKLNFSIYKIIRVIVINFILWYSFTLVYTCFYSLSIGFFLKM